MGSIFDPITEGIQGIGYATGLKRPKPGDTPGREASAEAPVYDVINEAFGIEQRAVRNPDGTIKEIKITELPLSPEEQALRTEIETGIQDTIESVNRVSAMGIDEFLNTEAVQQFRDYQTALLDRTQGRVSQQQEEILAQRGITESTSSSEQRAALQGEFAQQRQQAGLNELQFAQQEQQNQLARQLSRLNALQAVTGQQQANLQAGQQGALGAQGLVGNLVGGQQQLALNRNLAKMSGQIAQGKAMTDFISAATGAAKQAGYGK